MGGSRREAFGRRRDPRFQYHHGDARRRGKAVRRTRLCDFPGLAGGEFRRRTRLPAERSRQAVRAYLLHRAVEHGGKSGRVDQRRLRCERLPDRRPDHRPPLRRPRRSRDGKNLRDPARGTKAVAGGAWKLNAAARFQHQAALAFRRSKASRINGKRSLPKYMSVLSTKMVGVPKPPRAITSSVLALS